LSLWQGASDLQMALGGMMKIGLVVFLLAFGLPCLAMAEDESQCKNERNIETTFCASVFLKRADYDLNLLWPKLTADADRMDATTTQHEFAEALLNSQRSWIAYRDAECAWQGFEAHRGSIEPMLVVGCKVVLTRQRIRQLQIGPSE
jgi:uncharacterized protein YecT (DUF1311 family)